MHIKKIKIIFVLLFLSNITFSQINTIILPDNRVDSLFETTAQLDSKHPIYIIKGYPEGQWLIYFDSINRQKLFEVTYKNQKTLLYKTWYKNGIIRDLVDNENNFEISWNSSGNICSFFNYTNDTCMFYGFKKNGDFDNQYKMLKISQDNFIKLNHYLWNKVEKK